jgi:hypothetical protein
MDHTRSRPGSSRLAHRMAEPARPPPCPLWLEDQSAPTWGPLPWISDKTVSCADEQQDSLTNDLTWAGCLAHVPRSLARAPPLPPNATTFVVKPTRTARRPATPQTPTRHARSPIAGVPHWPHSSAVLHRQLFVISTRRRAPQRRSRCVARIMTVPWATQRA